jgi:hypothetical protein
MATTPDRITVEVTIDLHAALRPHYDEDGELVTPSLEEAVFAAVVEQIAERTIKDAGKDFYPNMRARAREKLEEVMLAQAADIVEEQFAKVIVETDRFGQTTGSPRTFREYMTDRIMGWLKDNAPSRDYHNRKTNAQVIIEGTLNSQFTAELQKAIEAGKQQALAIVKSRSAEMMSKALGDLATRCESCGGTQGQHYRNCPIHGRG